MKKMVLILLSSLPALGMQDPSNLHHPCEAPMWKQATKLAGKRTYDNLEYIASGAGAIIYGYTETNAAILAANAAAAATANAAAFETTIMAAELTAEGAAIAAELIGQELCLGVGAHAIDSLATVLVVSPDPVSKVTLGTVAVAAIGIAGAVVICKQTYEWGCDVKNAYDEKQEFLKRKAELIRLYNEKKALNEAHPA